MDMNKSDSGAALRMLLTGATPLFSQMLVNSPKVKGLIKGVAEAEVALQTARAEGKQMLHDAVAKIEAADAEAVRRYAEFREAIGDLLSENGLHGVVDEFEANSQQLNAALNPAPPAPPEAG